MVESGINIGVHLLILLLFSSGYMLIKGEFVFTFFPLAMYKKIKLSVILRGGYAYSRGYVYWFCQMFQGLRLFKGVRLFRSLEYQKLFWPFTVWINCSSDLKIFANSRPSASNFKRFFYHLNEFKLIFNIGEHSNTYDNRCFWDMLDLPTLLHA